MKKIIYAILIIFVGVSLFMLGYGIADYQALKSVCNNDQTDILELIIEHDNHVEIITTHYDYKNGTGYLVVKDKNIYSINVKVKKIAPFRYEWVEVDL